MNHVYYDYIRQIHQQQYEDSLIQMELNEASRENPTLRKRSLLYLSDVLLTLGQRIRPAEFRVQAQGVQAQEGTLEIKAEGC
jgi:hypothetical protein